MEKFVLTLLPTLLGLGCASQMDRVRRAVKSQEGPAGVVYALAPTPEAPSSLVAPGLQGRILTSELNGVLTGYVNLNAIEAGESGKSFHNFGGQDRLWIGPEAGSFGLYFDPGAAINRETWRVPAPLNAGSMEVLNATAQQVELSREMDLVNYLGTSFKVRLTREISTLARDRMEQELGIPFGPDVEAAGIASRNALVNIGETAWKSETGLLNLWILGQFRGGKNTIVIAPFRSDGGSGPIYNDQYFGSVPAERLTTTANAVIFRADARRESKFGLSPQRTTGVAGSFDPDQNLLIVIKFDVHRNEPLYASFRWDDDPNGPFGGDVFQSYNANATSDPNGDFYELESVSPCRELGNGEALTHRHATYSFHGPRGQLDAIARGVLGISLADAMSALP